MGGVAGRKRRSRWEGGGGEDRAISEAIASFTGSSATLTPEQQRQLKDQQEVCVGRVGGGGGGGWGVEGGGMQ